MNTEQTKATKDSIYRKLNPIKTSDIFTSKKYGEIVVLNYHSSTNILIEFKTTGYVRTCTADSLRKDNVRDVTSPSAYGVGFIGVGKYAHSVKGIQTSASVKWMNMLKRAYQEQQQVSYIGTTVNPEWLNFQIFNEWFNKQPNNNKGLALDSDLLSFLRGEDTPKNYSENNCTLLCSSLNLKLSHLQRKLAQSAKARCVHPKEANLPKGMNFDTSHQNFRIFVAGVQVATRKRLLAALDVFDELNIKNFTEELEAQKPDLAPEVLSELSKFKIRFSLN
jgi:hypothetical protein